MNQTTNAQHTPGPWTLLTGEYDNGMTRKVIADKRDPRDASTFYAMIAGDAPCREANARLIAAAPDLLAALEEALPLLNNGCDSGCTVYSCLRERARAAIHKATGGQS